MISIRNFIVVCIFSVLTSSVFAQQQIYVAQIHDFTTGVQNVVDSYSGGLTNGGLTNVTINGVLITNGSSVSTLQNLESVLSNGVNAAGQIATNFRMVSGTGWAVTNNGIMVLGPGTSLGNIATNADGAMQTGHNTATQTIGALAFGAQQSGWNQWGTQTIGDGARGAQQRGHNAGTQTITDGAHGAQQKGFNLGTQTIGWGSYGAQQNGQNLATQTVGQFAHGAQQNGNNEGNQTIMESALGAQQNGHNESDQTIQNNANGAQQLGDNWGTQTIGHWAIGAHQHGNNRGIMTIGEYAYGAQQQGFVYTNSAATNNGIGAVQLFNLTNGQVAMTTTNGSASLMLGAGTASNRNAIVAGDGQVSHGDGSITAGGGFFVGDTPVVTNGGATINGSPITNGAVFTISGGGGGGGISNISVAGVEGTLTGSGSNVISSVSLASLSAAGVATNGQPVTLAQLPESVLTNAAGFVATNDARYLASVTNGGYANGVNFTNVDAKTVGGISADGLWSQTTNLVTGTSNSLVSIINSATNELWSQTTNLVTGTSNSLVSIINSATNGLWSQTTNLVTGTSNSLVSIINSATNDLAAGFVATNDARYLASLTNVTYAAAPTCYRITLTNTSALSWTNTWLPTSKVSRVTLTSTGTVTFVWNWPTQQDAGMRFALDRTGMPAVIFPTGAIYLTNGIYGTSAPVLGKSNYIWVIHDDNTYQIGVNTNGIGTWGTP